MADKKSALIGCKQGGWVCIAGMRRPVLRVKGPEDVVVTAVFSPEITPHKFTGAGDHTLPESSFVQLHVIEGDPKEVLCLILTGKAAAAA